MPERAIEGRRNWRPASIALGALLAVALLPAGASAATIQVNDDVDSGSLDQSGCTLRDAVSAANNNAPFGECNGDAAGPDTIVLQSGHTYQLQNLGGVEDLNASGDLDVTGTTTITTDGAAPATIVGNTLRAAAERDRVIQVLPTSGGLTLQNLVVRDGLVQQPGSVGGGGILSDAPLTITNSEIRDNRVQVNGTSTQGGGIYVRGPLGTLTMTGSTVAGNVSQVSGDPMSGTQALGGGISVYNGSPMATITNSTISGNQALGVDGVGPGLVGGAFFGDYGTRTPTTLTSDTITQNLASHGGAVTGGLQITKGTMSGTIVAGNTSDNDPPDCFGDPDESLGANILGIDTGINSCGGFVFSGQGDLVGTTASPVIANLGALLPNGGPTRTNALNPGSPAINRGGTCPATDQRGFLRAPVAPCDSGAFELNAPASLPSPAGAAPQPAAPRKCKKKKHKRSAVAAKKKCKKKR
jgi:hypothetical protein